MLFARLLASKAAEALESKPRASLVGAGSRQTHRGNGEEKADFSQSTDKASGTRWRVTARGFLSRFATTNVISSAGGAPAANFSKAPVTASAISAAGFARCCAQALR